MPQDERSVRKVNDLTQTKRGAGNRPFRPKLLASAKLSDRKTRQLIHCYADGRTPREAIEVCGLSHVTVRRIYRYIRRRLMFAGLYERLASGAPEGWRESQLPELLAIMRARIRPHRGVKDENVELYYAEAMFRAESGIKPGQLYGLILKAIQDYGPLNREPELDRPSEVMGERLRLLLAQARRTIRMSEQDPRLRSLLLATIDDFEQEQERRAGRTRVEIPDLQQA